MPYFSCLTNCLGDEKPAYQITNRNAERAFFCSRNEVLAAIETLHSENLTPDQRQEVLTLMIRYEIAQETLPTEVLNDDEKLAAFSLKNFEEIEAVIGEQMASKLLHAKTVPFVNRVISPVAEKDEKLASDLNKAFGDALFSYAMKPKALSNRLNAASIIADLGKWKEVIMKSHEQNQISALESGINYIDLTLSRLQEDQEQIDGAIKQILSELNNKK